MSTSTYNKMPNKCAKKNSNLFTKTRRARKTRRAGNTHLQHTHAKTERQKKQIFISLSLFLLTPHPPAAPDSRDNETIKSRFLPNNAQPDKKKLPEPLKYEKRKNHRLLPSRTEKKEHSNYNRGMDKHKHLPKTAFKFNWNPDTLETWTQEFHLYRLKENMVSSQKPSNLHKNSIHGILRLLLTAPLQKYKESLP